MAKITEHVVYDIDEIVSFGTVRLSSATLESLKAELDEKETGHHVGHIALIHSSRVAVNERVAREAAERQYMAEFGQPNPNALEYYRSLPDPENPQVEPTEDAELPEEHVAEVPLHPTPDPDPHGKAEQEKAEWLRKEAEAKEHPAE